MSQIIRELMHELDAVPGLTSWEFTVACYTVNLLENFVMDAGLSIWDDIDAIKDITENDLLNGAKNWLQYSRDGNDLFWTRDINMRLFWTEKLLASPEKLIMLQGKALAQASRRILQKLKTVS